MATIKEVKDDSIIVKYKGKKITINITQELSINEKIINSQLKEFPSSYAFLCMLRDKAIKVRDSLEREKNAAYSKAYILNKKAMPLHRLLFLRGKLRTMCCRFVLSPTAIFFLRLQKEYGKSGR